MGLVRSSTPRYFFLYAPLLSISCTVAMGKHCTCTAHWLHTGCKRWQLTMATV